MTKQELTALNDSMPALTARQQATIIRRGQAPADECAKHPRTKVGHHYLSGVAAMQSFKGYAVMRYFHVHSTIRLGKLAETTLDEVMRIFYRENGKRYIFARPVKPLMQVCDAYYYDRPMALRPEPRATREDIRINVSFDNVILSMPRHLAMRGYCTKVATYAVPYLYTHFGEALCKQHQFAMLAYASWHGIEDSTRTALRICARNNYIVRDPRDYDDYIRMLDELGLDIHNAHYVCPADFHKAHQEILVRRNRVKEQALTKRRFEECKAYEKDYAKRMAEYLGIVLQANGITIRPLQSVREFVEEGAAMHHCVYACGYYRQDNCLILSARDAEGHRLATIELNLRTGNIVQCRGCCNTIPEKDKVIRAIINKNINSIIHPSKKAA